MGGRPRRRFVETFSVATWVEHLRQHHRVTLADLALEERVRALGSPQAVEHLVVAWSLERLREEGRELEPHAAKSSSG